MQIFDLGKSWDFIFPHIFSLFPPLIIPFFGIFVYPFSVFPCVSFLFFRMSLLCVFVCPLPGIVCRLSPLAAFCHVSFPRPIRRIHPPPSHPSSLCFYLPLHICVSQSMSITGGCHPPLSIRRIHPPPSHPPHPSFALSLSFSPLLPPVWRQKARISALLAGY